MSGSTVTSQSPCSVVGNEARSPNNGTFLQKRSPSSGDRQLTGCISSEDVQEWSGGDCWGSVWFVFASGSHVHSFSFVLHHQTRLPSILLNLQPHSESLLRIEALTETAGVACPDPKLQCTPAGPQLGFPSIGSTEDNNTENTHKGVFSSQILPLWWQPCFML